MQTIINTIASWGAIIKQQIIEVDCLRRVVTALVVAVFALEVSLVLLANFIVGGPFDYAAAGVLAFIGSALRFPIKWVVTDDGIKEHCKARLHIVAMAFTAILAPLLGLLALLVCLLKSIRQEK